MIVDCHDTIQFLAKNDDIPGLQRELHLDPNKPFSSAKVNAAVANMALPRGSRKR